jgi:hypothetical protein
VKRNAIIAGLVLLGLALAARADKETPRDAKDVKPVTVPFELFETKHIGVMVKINGNGPYRVIFDTGAPLTLLSTKVAKENKLIDPKAPKPLLNPFNAMGEAKLKSLEVGDLKIEDTSAMIMDHPAVEAMSKAFGGVEGIVGFPFFARYKMTIDYQKKEMTFVPNGYEPGNATGDLQKMIMGMLAGGDQGPKILSPAGQWGMVVEKGKKDDDAGVTIKEVMPGGAAAKAGLKAGDRLLTLDDRWTDTINDTYLAASLVKPGSEVKVTFKRDGKSMEANVKPVSGL